MLTEMASPGRQSCQSVGPASAQAEGRALNDSGTCRGFSAVKAV